MAPISIFNVEPSIRNHHYNRNQYAQQLNDIENDHINNINDEEDYMDIDEEDFSEGEQPFVDENNIINEKHNKINKINVRINQLDPIKNFSPSIFINIQTDLLEFQIKYSNKDVGQYVRNKFENLIEDTDKVLCENNNKKNNNNNKKEDLRSIFYIQYEMFKLQSCIAGDQDETISKDIRHYYKKMFCKQDSIESSSLYTFLHLLKLYISFLTTVIKNQIN
ncbi:hypothetical protein DICPUDRAFT_158004 [Dictyostelium purpureum]|uniref:Uncharacterized protein n=1 Tax=Dictyostelium purpureum TaxID=5786 RepID=F1A0K3_DICPU|nr:uncharacterized protein DICPUDRAFT_158004 [Dictyostelium purpureum]EGC30269.1 hypothetical protein DICPUDRAFT_158004 [Dictyostelium purpureum]|eukprot:XP_003293196.1 hypothetical protein DICPUDRAFT_158004 [Dictyostelium purpureum]